MAVAEINADSPGEEIILGRGDVLEIRSGQTLALLDSSAGHQQINSIAVGELDGANSGLEIVVGQTWNDGARDYGQLLVLDPGQSWEGGRPDVESACLLLEGEAFFRWEGQAVHVSRRNPFQDEAYCLHAGPGAAFSGSDPGRQRRADARGRQVRL